MRPIPIKMREEMANDFFMRSCCLKSVGGCNGRIEFHHAIIYSGRQLNEKFAIVPLCHSHHEQPKCLEMARLVALRRASESDLAKLPRRDWKQELTHLENKYGQMLQMR